MTDSEQGVLVEQFKTLVADVGNVGTRYAAANGFYLTVITGMIAILAYTGTARSLQDMSAFVIALVCFFASIVCYIWGVTMSFYGELFGAKFGVLKQIEKHFPVQAYELEGKDLYEVRKAPFLTKHEAAIPRVLGFFFAMIGVMSLVAYLVRAAQCTA